MITVPAAFAEWRIRADGEAGRKWVRSLPDVVERLAARWDLTLDDAPPLHGALGLVVLVHRDRQPLVLKLSWREQSTENEALALRAWDGRGVMALLADDPDSGALLLERLDHNRSLHTLPVLDAGEVAGSLIRTLAVPAPTGVRSLAEVADGIVERLPRRQRALGDPIPAAWVRAACGYAAELGSVGEQVLIHADLHYGNVLAATRQPWLAIDPRPLRGAPEYSVPELLWTRADDLRTDADVRTLLHVITTAGNLNPHAARGWVLARAVDYWLWAVERGLTIDPARCERIVRALS